MVLLSGLLITFFASVNTYVNIEKNARSEFLFSCTEIRNKIISRLNAQAQVLQSGVGLFNAKDTVTRKDWRTFVEHSKFIENFPGILGVGFAIVIQPKDLEKHMLHVRQEGFPGYTVKPSGARDIYTSILYLEPLKDRNLRAFGYDMLTEETRRKALTLSKELNIPILSGKVTLVQETKKDVQAGTLMFLPVYKKGHPLASIDERRKAITGWVYSPYRMNDMMAGIIGNWNNNAPSKLNFTVYDGDKIAESSVLYKLTSDSTDIHSNIHYTHIDVIDFNTTRWTLFFSKSKVSFFNIQYYSLWLIFLGGSIISILLFLLFRSLIQTRQQAYQIAERLTHKLRESETRLRFAIEGSKLGTWDWDVETGTVIYNEYWASMLGYTLDEIPQDLKTWEKLVHPDDMPGIQDLLFKHMTGESEFYQTEHRLKTKNGEWKWVLDTGKITERDSSGDPIRLVGTHIDISERKQSEELENIERDLGIKLSKASSLEETMRICLKAAIVYAQMDAGGIYTVDETDKSLNLLFHKGLPKEFIDKTSQYPANSTHTELILKGEPIYYNYSQICASTNYILAEEGIKSFASIPVKHLNEVIGSINIGSYLLDEVPCQSRIVLERIATYIGSFIVQATHEDKLTQNRQNLNTLFNSIDDFIFIMDTEGKIIYFNSPLIDILKYNEADLLGQHVSQIFTPSATSEINQIISNVLFEHAEKFQFPMLHKDKTELPVETKISKSVWSGQLALIAISHDISDRKNYEFQLKQNSERLEMALVATNAGLWDWNIKTGELVINEKWASMRGFKEDEVEINVNTWEATVHPDDKEFVLFVLEQHLTNKTSFYQVEYRTAKKTGGYIWILDTGKVIEYNESGEPLRMVGTNIDITSRKEDEFKLQQNLEQQELLSEVAQELNSLEEFDVRLNHVLSQIGKHTNVSRVYIFEDDFGGQSTSNTFEWCNTGITAQKEELQHIPYEMIPSWKELLLSKGRVYSEDISLLPEDLRAILEPQEIKSIIVYPLFVKGNFFGFMGFDECMRFKNWTKAELELLRTLSGIIINAYERRLSENSLVESESKNRAILESMPDILFHFNKQGVILSFRSSNTEDLAITPEDFLNKSIHELFPKQFAEMAQNSINQCLQDGNYNFEYAMPIHDRLTYFEARMSKMNENEVISIVRNVTERKENERQLKEERDRANLANKAKSEFLANMSHEIRTPMNAILGFSEALYHQLDSSQHKKMVKSVLSSGNLLLSLLNDILDLSKIEAGKMEISSQPADFKNILQEIRLLFSDKAQKKGIDLHLNIPDDFPNVLMLDEIRIKQVIFNLVGNAIKFTHKGFVEMSARFEPNPTERGTLIFEVKDSGIGIPESEQQIIFEAFMQQSGQSSRKYGGAGLGLAISKRLVEKMEGTISVTSIESQGSTFAVTIPNVQVSELKTPRNEPVTNETNITFESASLLVIDDVSSNIEMVENLLSPYNLIISTADNGEMALEILNHTTPDIILLDIRMPGIDGFEVARQIKTKPDKQHIPIIAFTASVFSSEKIEGSGYFNGVLYKPVNKAALLGQLSKYLKHTSIIQDQAITSNLTDSILISDDMKANWPQLEQKLNTEFTPRWEGIKDTLVLFNIENFARDLLQVAEKYQFDPIIKYATRLAEDVDMVDLESLKEDLRKFPGLVFKISTLIHS